MSNTKDTPMDYKQFEGHTVGTNDFLVRNLREYANDLRVVNGILPKQDIVRAADLIESLKLELQKQKVLKDELVKCLKEMVPLAEDGYTLHRRNGSHQEFLSEDKERINLAESLIKKSSET